MGIERVEAIARARVAFREGVSASRWILDMRSLGMGYSRTTMLADFRTVNQLERKEGVLRYVRKGYYPAEKSLASVTWAMSKEYMYKVKVQSRITPDAPILDRFVNIMSDRPLTPLEMESQVTQEWGAWERYAEERIVSLQVWSAVRRVME